MKRMLAAGAIAVAASAGQAAAQATAAPPAAAPSPAALPAGAVRHIVVFKFKPGATQAQIDEVTRAFGALKDKIPGIVAFEYGVNNSPEKLNQGFTHVYMLTFTNAAARDAYLPHPAHKAFGALLGRVGIWAGGFVVDYESRS